MDREFFEQLVRYLDAPVGSISDNAATRLLREEAHERLSRFTASERCACPDCDARHHDSYSAGGEARYCSQACAESTCDHAELVACPACNGGGRVGWGDGSSGHPCTICDGTGWCSATDADDYDPDNDPHEAMGDDDDENDESEVQP